MKPAGGGGGGGGGCADAAADGGGGKLPLNSRDGEIGERMRRRGDEDVDEA